MDTKLFINILKYYPNNTDTLDLDIDKIIYPVGIEPTTSGITVRATKHWTSRSVT